MESADLGPVRSFSQAELAPDLPRRGNALLRWLAGRVYDLVGWRLEGEIPNRKKMVIVGAPHTSNWDGVHAVMTLFALGLDLRWMVKDDIFVPPFGRFLRWIGAVPVDRKAAQNVVRQVIDHFENRDQFLLVIAPEGTRSRVDRWKSGFYRIALGAGVPIVLAYGDYARKVVGFGPVIEPSGDMDADMEKIYAFYRTITPRHPERAGGDVDAGSRQ